MVALFVIGGTLFWGLVFLAVLVIFKRSRLGVLKALIATLLCAWAAQAFALVRLEHCSVPDLEWGKSVFLLKPSCPIHLGNTEPFTAAGFAARFYGVILVLLSSGIAASLSFKKQRTV